MILAYPVITFEEPYAHRGSRDALLGPNPDPALVELLSNEEHVTKDTPPTFLFHTSDDPVVPVQNSIYFYLALRRAGVPAEMHIYEHGKHGVGLAQDIPELSTWPTLLANWLKLRGYAARRRGEERDRSKCCSEPARPDRPRCETET